MQAILDFFTGIWDILSSLAGFAISFMEDLAYLVKLCSIYLVQIPNYFSWLPSSFRVFVVTIFSVVFIYKIIGREG